MGKGLDQLTKEYTDVFGQLRKKLKWHVTDERVLIMVASLFVIKGKKFELDEFLQVSDYIKKNSGLFSSLRSSQRYTMAAMLILRFDNPTDRFHDLIKIYDKLVGNGFKRGAFSYIAAISLLTNEAKEENLEASIQRAAEVFKGMKKGHIFLTGQSDYPLAVLLAQSGRNVENLMDDIDYYYDNLSKNGFKKGNDLQFLSHVLSLQQEEDEEEIIDRCTYFFHEFKQAGRRVKPMYYPTIGLLALLENSMDEVDSIMTLFERLNGERLFRWHKDMNFIMAINFIVKDKVEDKSLISTGIQTTIETVIQAQQAAMIAAMAGGAAVASTSSNS